MLKINKLLHFCDLHIRVIINVFSFLPIQAALSEIFASMWVRNGVQIKCQAMTYVQCHFCASMADLDIFFLQVSHNGQGCNFVPVCENQT